LKPEKSISQRVTDIEKKLDFCLDKIAKHEVKLDKLREHLK